MKNNPYLGINWPVHLWIEDVCVNRTSAQEMAYIQSLIPEVYAKFRYNACYLLSGDASISTFIGVSRLLSKHVDRFAPGMQGLAS